MKVNEVITEAGFFKSLGQDVASWLAKSDIKKASSLAGAAINKWTAQVDKLEQAGQNMKDPETYYKFLNEWLGKWLRLGKPYPGNPSSFDRTGIYRHIQQAVAQYETGTMPKGEVPPTKGADDRPAGNKRSTSGLHPDVSVVATSPNIILRYKKQDFVLDEPTGGSPIWYKFPTGRRVPKEVKNFLNKQLEQL